MFFNHLFLFMYYIVALHFQRQLDIFFSRENWSDKKDHGRKYKKKYIRVKINVTLKLTQSRTLNQFISYPLI